MNRDNGEYESLNRRAEDHGLFSGSPMFRNNQRYGADQDNFDQIGVSSDPQQREHKMLFEEPSGNDTSYFMKGTEYDLFGQIESQAGPSKRD